MIDSVQNSNFDTRFDKKTRSLFKQDNKSKSKKKKMVESDLDQDNLFKKKNKSKVTVNTQDDLVNKIEVPFKSNKLRKKEKVKQKSNINSYDSHITNGLSSGFNTVTDNINKYVLIDSPLSIEELSSKLQIPPAEIIMGLFLQGISVTINQIIDISIATQVAEKYNCIVLNQNHEQESEQSDKLQEISSAANINRAPIVTILGHVDHGKTTLLDAIRNTNFAGNEIGGITQAISVYEVNWLHNLSNKKLIFIDTPGHQAFSTIRLRCAQITDIVILIVAADDDLKPQTIEVIDYILSKKIPCVVAINKIDKVDINLTRLKSQLADYNITSKDWGGKIEFVEISALKKINIDKLLTSICCLADSINLKADPTQLAQGIILEAYVDKTKGIVANMVVLNGTLHIGDVIVSGNSYGRVKKIINSLGNELVEAEPSSNLKVLGFYSMPTVGTYFHVVNNEKEAKKSVARIRSSSITKNTKNLLKSNSKFYNTNTKNLNLIVKADTQGTIDAIINSLMQIPQKKIQLNILTASLGVVSNTDLDLAYSTQGVIIAFNIDISTNILNAAEKLDIPLYKFVLIYDLIDHITNYMLNLIDTEYEKYLIGQAEVQTTFSVNKGTVAGCIVKSGKLKKSAFMHVYRNNHLIYEGVINSLKRMKNDTDEVNVGNECGVLCEAYHLWQPKDSIKAYELHEKPKTL
uniref:Translation initiation factor IF-2, chloroplastic n=1 Tax=Gracilaria vermiculophylla TaxID=2608709 RepID=A0A8F7GPU3_9FLOR|nr:translation initiation factor 2 [Gracilaria vermiculophylla]WDZ67883.1 translation initiation factor 2 [Gracilaria vermiculophylla]